MPWKEKKKKNRDTETFFFNIFIRFCPGKNRKRKKSETLSLSSLTFSQGFALERIAKEKRSVVEDFLTNVFIKLWRARPSDRQTTEMQRSTKFLFASFFNCKKEMRYGPTDQWTNEPTAWQNNKPLDGQSILEPQLK